MPLGELQVRNAKPQAKPYKLTDGEGMFLLVQPNGSRLWRLAYRFGGKQKTLALGIYPHVTLAQARKRRADAKAMLADGRDPGQVKIEEKEKAKPAETFEQVARRWYDTNKDTWVDSHGLRILNRLDRDVFPVIGSRPIDAINPPEVLKLLRDVESRGAVDIAKRLRQEIGSVYRFAIAEGIAKSNPAADVGAALKASRPVKHRARVRTAEALQLYQDIAAYDGDPTTRLALLFTLHTFLRTNEVRFAPWSEFDGVDLDGPNPVWRIPGERMKMGREHIVPLTPTVVGLLREVKKHQDGPLVFPGQVRKAMSENTMLYALYRMGYHSRQTVHGFRGLASTTLNEAGFNSDWVERQLAHVEENQIRGAYNAAEYLPGRIKMMQWWSDYLEGKASMTQLAA